MGKATPHSQAFEALANRYRRRLLFALLESNLQDDDLNPLDLQRGDGTEDAPGVTTVDLKHVHLPKLADMGFIAWNQEDGEISKGPNWERIAPILRLLREYENGLPAASLSGPSNED